MQRTVLGLLFLFTSCACLAGNDVWETLFKEKLKEANAGNSNAQYDIGAMYQNGRGVAASRDKAIEWYRKAAAQNNQNAISRLNLIQSNEERFNKTLARAGEGDMGSQYDLGKMYTEGLGIDTDMAKAIEWYQKAAAQGNEKAQFKLGLIYYEESSPDKDRPLAFRLFRQAAEKGYPAAQFYLGKMYASGEVVSHDYKTALEWLGKAVGGGFNEARREMIEIAELLEDDSAGKDPEPVNTVMPDTKPTVAILKNPGTVSATATRMPPNARPAASLQVKAPVYTYENLMLASWNRDNEPVAYLPSAINNCRLENDKLVCFSDDQSRDTATGKIKYKTKAIISNPAEDGSFEVVYRNLVIDADHDSGQKKSGSEEVVGSTTTGTGNMNYEVKTGWGKEHSLQCRFKDSSMLSCLKNNTHAFMLESPQTLAGGK